MWNKIYITAILSLLTLASCKKDDTVWDREVDLDLDTLTCQISIDYIVQSSSKVDLQIKMLKINGLDSEMNYTGQTFSLSPNSYVDYGYEFTNITVIEDIPVNDYTTVLLFQNSGEWWFEENKIGIYLRRYLELYGDTRNIATAYFDYVTDEPIVFSNKNGGSIFDNNWEDDIEMYYNTMKQVDQYPDYVPFEHFANRLNETMDSLIINYPTLPNKSITVFAPTYYDFVDDALFAQIWDKANTYNIQINFLGYDFSSFRQIANETGGFVIENNYDPVQNSPLSYYEETVSPVGVTFQNLDKILSKNYTMHTATLSVTDLNNGGAFFPGNFLYVRFIYNGIQFAIDIRLP